ncbi:PAS domain-containing protein [Deferribacter thermophilus]|uniref:PAS domain-containing protein n=1 Tax=Deferribacter thermophilus TaxID=53573 RepID=UPI003C2E11CF
METVKKIPFVIMIFTEESSKKIATVKEVNLSVEKENYYKELEYELQITKENLQATIEELETANDELQATNEELLASNEELQSTNEELQSTNEELYIVNTELQEKILEKAEIQSYLENLLNYSETDLLILDNSLKIKRFSPKIKEIFKIIDSDIGRSIEHINHNLEDVDIYNIFKDVVKNQENIELEVKSTTGKWYKMSSAIIELGISGINYGVIVKFEDITRIKEEQFFLKVKENIISEIFNKYGITGWYFDIINNNIYLSKETYKIFDLDAKNIRIDAKDYFNKIIKQIDNKDKFKKLLEDASKKGKPFDEEFTYKKDDKTTLKIKITGEPIKEKRKVIAIVGTIKII